MEREVLRQKLRNMAQHQGNERGNNAAEREVAAHKLRCMRFEDNEFVVKMVRSDLAKLSREELEELYIDLYLDAWGAPK